MIERTRRFFAVAAILVFAGLAGTPTQAASLLEKNFWLSGPRYEAVVPLCEDPFVLAKVQTRFGQKESRYWQSALQIVGFDHVRELAFRPWAEFTIPRRFCGGVVYLNDGTKRPVYYNVIEDGGFAGVGSGVEFCVVGLDRAWAFNPACSMARPRELSTGIRTRLR